LDAVQAAVEGQQAIRAEPWDTIGLPQGQPLRVRMALHSGVVQERNGDYFGLPLSRIARRGGAGARAVGARDGTAATGPGSAQSPGQPPAHLPAARPRLARRLSAAAPLWPARSRRAAAHAAALPLHCPSTA